MTTSPMLQDDRQRFRRRLFSFMRETVAAGTRCWILTACLASYVTAAPLPDGTLLTIERFDKPYWTSCSSGSHSCMEIETFLGTSTINLEPGADGGLIIGKNQASGGQEGDGGGAITLAGEMTDAVTLQGYPATIATAPITGFLLGVADTDATLNLFDDQLGSCTYADCVGKTELGTLNLAWRERAINLGSADGCNSYNCDANQLSGWQVEKWTRYADDTYELRYSNVITGEGANGLLHDPVTVILRGRIFLPPAPVYSPPTAGDLSYTIDQGHSLNWVPDVYDPEGAPMTCRLVQGASGVSVAADCSGGTFTPSPTFAGVKEFTYIANDGVWDSKQGTVTVTVNGTGPTAGDIRRVTAESSAVNWTPVVSASGAILCSIVTPPTHGTASVASDCSTGQYNPSPGYAGGDWFTYKSSDGFADSLPAYATVRVGDPNPVLLPAGTRLTIESIVGGSFCGGPCWTPEVAPGIDLWTAILPGTDGGLIIGKDQLSGGQELAGGGSSPAAGELTEAISFFGQYGSFATAPLVGSDGSAAPTAFDLNFFSEQSCAGLDCVGRTEVGTWNWAWNGSAIPMGSGVDPCKDFTACTSAQRAGIFVDDWTINPDDTYELRFTGMVPSGHASGFGGLWSYLYLEGRVIRPECRSEPCLAPEVTGIWPASAAPGETISLFVFGDSFDLAPGATQVYVNGVPQSVVQVVTPEMLIARVTITPEMLGGPVTVTTSKGSAVSPTNFGTPLSGVNITGIWPASASVGDFVFVFGSGYEFPMSVTIGATAVPLVQVVTSDMFIMIVPLGASTGPVSVTTPSGSATSTEDLVIVP
jgi:hypothetical protein